jgi:uncharacterized membrane protein YedE/YeeE
LLLVNGKVAGVSGILGTLLSPGRSGSDDRSWRAFFIAGLLGAGVLFSRFWPSAIGDATVPLSWMVLAGVLVGAGSGLGRGCTSGHGVCGIARGSKRSIVATVTFMAAGFLTVYVLHHALFRLP